MSSKSENITPTKDYIRRDVKTLPPVPQTFVEHVHLSVSDLSVLYNTGLDTVAGWLGTTTAPKKGHNVPHTPEAKAKIFRST